MSTRKYRNLLWNSGPGTGQGTSLRTYSTVRHGPVFLGDVDDWEQKTPATRQGWGGENEEKAARELWTSYVDS